jgi:hypothetical protein
MNESMRNSYNHRCNVSNSDPQPHWNDKGKGKPEQIVPGINGIAADKNGSIAINGIASFVEELLPRITYKKWGYEQIPQKTLMGMDFPIGMR